MRPAFNGRIGELVNALPARVWDYTDPADPAKWTDVSLALYAADRFQPHPRVTLDGGLRYEYVSGSAATGTGSISWNALLPRAGIRWELTNWNHIATLAGYSRTAHRLTLTDLAWGDASAPSGSVYRWNAPPSAIHAPTSSEIGTLVARVGPGSQGTSGFASIDPDLKRPYMDELTFGFEGRPTPSTVFRLTGIGRREQNMIAAFNEGAPESAYTLIRVSDEGLFGDGSLLPVFDRRPATFGADRYTLTNPADHETTFVGAELTGQAQTSRLFLIFGLTAGRSEGLSASRGFRAIENDAALIGELYANPNARTYAQGRMFTERGYTIKLSSVYHFAHDIQLGFAARYQDGQHFSRLIVVPTLNQGPELVRAFRNGRTRFTFTGTLDARLQKGFAFGSRRLAAVLEGYNILNMGLEVEEVQVTGALSRATTAVLPPRALHVGVRLTF
jgi:outer membrane receptor protein involved in Fe transport